MVVSIFCSMQWMDSGWKMWYKHISILDVIIFISRIGAPDIDSIDDDCATDETNNSVMDFCSRSKKPSAWGTVVQVGTLRISDWVVCVGMKLTDYTANYPCLFNTSTVYWCMVSNLKALRNVFLSEKNQFMCGFICLQYMYYIHIQKRLYHRPIV